MKTVKIILAILLLLALLPASGCVFMSSMSSTYLEEEFGELPIDSLTALEISRVPNIRESLDNTASSLSFLLICTFLFVLSAGIIAIAWREKFYGALVSGVLVLIPYVWNNSLQKTIKIVAKEPILRRLDSISSYENTSGLFLANFLLFLPMALLLIIGVIDVISHFTKKAKKVSVPETSTIEKEVVTAPQESNIDDLKKYKELLDAGVINQEEFDAKKKQLLGL